MADHDVPHDDAVAWRTRLAAVAGRPGTGRTTANGNATASETQTQPLAVLFEAREHVVSGGRRWEYRAERTIAATRESAGDVFVTVRPAMRGKSGRWAGGNLTWTSLQFQVNQRGLDPRQVRWFAEFSALANVGRTGFFGADSSRLVLDSYASPQLWPMLLAARRLGIELVSASPHGAAQSSEVHLVGELAVRFDARGGPGGGVLLMPVVQSGETIVPIDDFRPTNDHGLYRVEWPDEAKEAPTLTLGPTSARLSSELRALVRNGPIRVPAGEADDFVRDYLPALRRVVDVVSSDPSLVLPDPGAPAATSGADGAVTTENGASDAAPVLSALPPDPVELTETPKLTVTTVETDKNDWFELGVLVTVGGKKIPFGPLFRALARGERKLKLVDNSFLSLTQPLFDGLRELIAEAVELPEWETGRPKISRMNAALWADFEDLADVSEPALAWRETVGGLLALAAGDAGSAAGVGADDDGAGAGAAAESDLDAGRRTLVDRVSVPDSLVAELRPYQRGGFDWLVFLRRHELGGILADDMGLGKTVQTLAMIAQAIEEGGGNGDGRGGGRNDDRAGGRSDDRAARPAGSASAPSGGHPYPYLVVAPTSVVPNWLSEAARFTPSLRVAHVDGTKRKTGGMVADAAAGSDIVVTSYALFRLRFDEFDDLPWSGLILDEAQFVKNRSSRANECARLLETPFKLAITGTPMENNLTELWAIFSIVAPGLFPSLRRFSEQYVRPLAHAASDAHGTDSAHGARVLARLRRRIRPLMLRRTKERVAPELPERQEQVVRVELAPAHRRVYDAYLQRERQKLFGLIEDLDRNRFIVFRSLTLLRMLALDASLIDDEFDEHVPSSKLDALLEQLDDVIAEGHRALVFSQFTSYLSVVAARLEENGITHAYLDGSTTKRASVIEGFTEGAAPVFLISLKAGGFGLNLTQADYVFLLDPWWNPAAEAQAVDRTHRIGQTRNVMVYRMVAADTIEEKVVELAARKATLFDAVLTDDGAFSGALSAQDVRELLG